MTGAKFQDLFNFSITNYVKFPVFHVFEKMNKGQLKIVKVNY